MLDKFPMTKRGYDTLEEELRHLKNEERHRIIKAIAEAREHGDLSENAEYHAARERQSFVEGRIQELEAKLSRAEVIDAARLAGSETVTFGCTVTLADDATDEESTYQIVGEDEADIRAGRLSVVAPLARAIIGKKVNASAEVSTPKGLKTYTIINVVWV